MKDQEPALISTMLGKQWLMRFDYLHNGYGVREAPESGQNNVAENCRLAKGAEW